MGSFRVPELAYLDVGGWSSLEEEEEEEGGSLRFLLPNFKPESMATFWGEMEGVRLGGDETDFVGLQDCAKYSFCGRYRRLARYARSHTL